MSTDPESDTLERDFQRGLEALVNLRGFLAELALARNQVEASTNLLESQIRVLDERKARVEGMLGKVRTEP